MAPEFIHPKMAIGLNVIFEEILTRVTYTTSSNNNCAEKYTVISQPVLSGKANFMQIA